MREQLGLSSGTIILVTKKGYGIHSSDLSAGEMDRITREAQPHFTSYYDGVKFLADQATQEIQSDRSAGQRNLLMLALLAIGGIAFFRSRKLAAQKKRITELNRQLNERLAALQDEFKRFDLETPSVEDSPLLQEAKQLRSAAVDPFAEAGEKFNVAQTVAQYEEADAITTQAERLAAKARVRLEQAQGKRPLDDPNEPGSIPRAEDVPADDRGACFFCSKPSRLRDLHPLEIDMAGQAQRVLACDDCYDVAKTGRQPQILAVPDEQGRRVPWYQSNRYDPWNDYGRGGMFGGGGIFGGGFGLMDYLLLENLFDHGLRSNPVVISPQDSGYGGGHGGGIIPDPVPDADSGSGDFLGAILGGGSNGDSGGGDFFGGDSGGGDFFGGDSGGGDFFGGDSGGGDL
jgi:hypothetical protein